MTYTNTFKYPILITGGAGFLGSHMIALCLEKKVDVVVIDNLSNSDLSNLQKLESHFKVSIPFFNIDIRVKDKLNQFFNDHQFSAVIHFAGLKSVSESVVNPDLYFENNVQGSANLITCIKKYNINKVIFSSSATVYGDPKYLPIDEKHPLNPVNPYGVSKMKVEKLFLEDDYFHNASIKLLRYFNPVGSYKGIIGEKPNKIPDNLMPYIIDVAKGKFKYLNIFGDDYDTFDGTGVRDFIHIMDLIEAHWVVLNDNASGCNIFNIGRGEGVSVKQLVDIFEISNQIKIPIKIQSRRIGDIASCYATVDKIKNDLNWAAKFNLEQMCQDAWKVNL
jgi:UDP-glucose 4-epimerase